MMIKKMLLLMVVVAVMIVAVSGYAFAAPVGMAGQTVVDADNLSAIIGNAVVDVDDGNSIVKIMGNIHIPQERVVKGDVVAVMGNIDVDGRVDGDVVAVMGNIALNNVVNGDVVSVLGSITKGPNAQINGETIETNSPGTFNFVSQAGLSNLNIGLRGLRFDWSFKIFNAVILFALASLVLALMPNHIKTMAVELGTDPFRKLMIGLLALVLMPVLVLVTALSLIGLPLVPVIILVFIGTKFIGYVAVALFIGHRARQTASLNINIFLELLVGVLLLWLIKLVPFLGLLTSLIVTLFALGLTIDTKFGTQKPWFKRRDYKSIEPPREKEENVDDKEQKIE
ncbi:polymer-forming cytoskeletal protein [Metallumcola ferriviriculae]|uniref:Polymer-forming cytoskeletal protein n=1 Tax=Metallumcola ferriviriculae TaxID=3039180 RepID=A0AAU0UNF3_9FIRM|nr:polymer-forming cytoskeletal protein [Desulfitibacteraceae bacterium MK1]